MDKCRLILALSVLESYLSQFVVSHKPAFVNVSFDAVEATFAGVLPHGDVSLVFQFRFTLGILRYHDKVSVQFACQMLVVEISASIYQRPLSVRFFHELQKFEQGIAELLRRQSTGRFYVNHRYDVLFAWSALRVEIL